MGELVSQIYSFGIYVSKCFGGVEPSYFSIKSGKQRLIGPVPAMGAINQCSACPKAPSPPSLPQNKPLEAGTLGSQTCYKYQCSVQMKLKRFKFKPHQLRADSSTCISWLVRGALCRYAKSACLTDFYRTKNSLNEEQVCVCVCV